MATTENEGGFASIGINASPIGTQLQRVLLADDIQPGSAPGYETCREIYLYHPLGAKIVETPVKMAQSQPRLISVKGAPDEVAKQFERVWEERQADYYIRGVMYQARIYGVGALVLGSVGVNPAEPLDPAELPSENVYFSVFDPLNVAGSLVLDQNPNSPMYQKHGDIAASGQVYHRSRACVVFNEQPIYIAYTSSAFGFSGRSVYQRALYPLKSFIQTMVTDDMVSRKAGLLVAMLRNAGSIVSRAMQVIAGVKRRLLKEAQTDQVLSIEIDEEIKSLDMQNIDKSMVTARSNIVKNIATACDTPAQVLEQESFAEGFGEGTEDTKAVIRFVNGVRKEMNPVYAFMDRNIQRLAWTPEFFESVKRANPGLYDGVSFEQAFYDWARAFTATWPNLLEEPESEQARMEKVKLEGLISVAETIRNVADPENIAAVIQWVVDNCNGFKRLFHVGLDLDVDALRDYITEEMERRREGEEQQQEEPGVRPRLSLTARGDAEPEPVRRRARSRFSPWYG